MFCFEDISNLKNFLLFYKGKSKSWKYLYLEAILSSAGHNCRSGGFFTLQPLKAVGVLFSPMVSGWVGGGMWQEKFGRAVSQKL